MLFRVSIFTAVCLVIASLEFFYPFSKKSKLSSNGLHNIGIHLLNVLMLSLPFLSLQLTAEYAQSKQLSALYLIKLSPLFQTILSLILLDFFIYWQHRFFHSFSFLWSLHKLHHTDKSLNLSTALRFNPLEIFVSLLFKMLLILAFGFKGSDILIYEIMLNAMALFNHGNFVLPKKLEKVLELFIVTPRLHRTHHSIVRNEQRMNLGNTLVIWDKIFGSFQDKSTQEDAHFKFGI